MLFLVLNMILIILLLFIFFLLSKEQKWNYFSKSVFECGFTSNFYSRFSFPIHYFLTALTFLLLDLELVFLMPFFLEESSNFKSEIFLLFFALILTASILIEWSSGLLDWKL